MTSQIFHIKLYLLKFHEYILFRITSQTFHIKPYLLKFHEYILFRITSQTFHIKPYLLKFHEYILFRITSVLKVETNIITSISIAASLIVYVKNFKTDVIVLIS